MKNNLRNRILAMLLSVLMLVGMIPVFGAETDSVVIEIGSVSFDRGIETAVKGYYLIDVPVKVTKNEGFISIKLNINYDDELKLAGWTEGTVFPYIPGDSGVAGTDELPASEMVSAHNITSSSPEDLAKNPFVVYYITTYEENNTSTGTLITLQFKVPADVEEGDYDISATVEEVYSQEGDVGADVETDFPTEITSSCSAKAGTITVEGEVDPDDTTEEDTTVEPDPIIDCVIIPADDIAVAGNPQLAGVGAVGDIVNNGLIDGMARFAVNSSMVGTVATTSDRAAISVDSVALADYPHVVMVYETNINAPQINFNIATAEGTYPSAETKIFTPQTRVVGELATAAYNWDGSKFGDTVKVIGIYVPIYSTTTPSMSADDYFDVQYVGFFKNAADAALFDYNDYMGIEDETKVLCGDVNADGKVDRKDLTRLAQYFARWTVEVDMDASDANGDGKVDRKDLTRLAQYFARWNVELGK